MIMHIFCVNLVTGIEARATAEKYLALVPDDVNMQTFLEDY